MISADNPLCVGVLGVDKRSRSLLRLFFDGPCKGRYKLVDHSHAKVTLIDIDAYGGANLKAQHDALYPGRPAILMSIKEQPLDEPLWLAKPLQGKALFSVLNEVNEVLEAQAPQPPSAAAGDRREVSVAGTKGGDTAAVVRHKPAPSSHAPGAADRSETRREQRSKASANAVVNVEAGQPASSSADAAERLDEAGNTRYLDKGEDINPHDPRQVQRVTFSNAELLQGYLQRAIAESQKSGCRVELTGIWRTIFIDPTARSVCYELSLSTLRSLCIMQTGASKVTIKPVATQLGSVPERSEIRTCHEPLDSFLWQIALWTSRGRIPDSVDLKKPVYLTHWPNFTRLAITPHALRIAALWIRHPYSLIRTAEILGIPQRYVFAFYTAAQAIGLAGQGRRQADMLVESPPPEQPRLKGLLGRILSRLRHQ